MTKGIGLIEKLQQCEKNHVNPKILNTSSKTKASNIRNYHVFFNNLQLP